MSKTKWIIEAPESWTQQTLIGAAKMLIFHGSIYDGAELLISLSHAVPAPVTETPTQPRPVDHPMPDGAQIAGDCWPGHDR